MKKLVRPAAMLLAVLMLCGALFVPPVSAGTKKYTKGDYEFTVNDDGTVEICKYRGSASILSIPKKLGSKKVTGIGFGVCNGNDKLEKVTVSGNVSCIGDYAFSYCGNLKTVVIGDSVRTVCYTAFRGCPRLKKVSTGNGLEMLRENAFANCTALTDLSLGMSIKSIGFGAFRECTSLKNVYYYGSEKAWEKVYVDKTLFFDEVISRYLLNADFTFGNNPIPELKTDKVQLKAGESSKIIVKNKQDGNLTYESSNSKVVSVKKGKVTALKKGKAEITVNSGPKRLKYTVRVTSSPTLSKSSVSVKKGASVKVKIIGKAKNINNVYTNTATAKIVSKNTAETIKVKGLKQGSTTLKVRVNGVLLKLDVKVK